MVTLVFSLFLWALSWTLANQEAVTAIRGFGSLVLLLFLSLQPGDMFEFGALTSQRLSPWIFISAIAWGTILLILIHNGLWPHPMVLPFLGVIPILLLWITLTTLVFLSTLIFVYGIYLVLLFLVDWLYLITRFGIIIQEFPKSSKRRKLILIPHFILISDSAWLFLSPAFLVFPLMLSSLYAFTIIIGLFLILMSFSVISIILYVFIPSIYTFITGAINYLKWFRVTSSTEFLPFVQNLELNKSKFFRSRMIRVVNRKQLIIIQTATKQHLRNLIAFVGGRILYPKKGQLEKIVDIDPVLGSCLTSENNWSSDQLDELVLLLEFVQAAELTLIS